MVSYTNASYHLLASPSSVADLNSYAFPSWVVIFNQRRRMRKRELVGSLNLVAAAKERESGGVFSGLLQLKRRNYKSSCCWCGGFVESCEKGWDGEGDSALEAQILEFMMSSENPEMFPTKKQLIDAGRMDLVDGIARQGGWLAFGWDLDDEDKEEQRRFEENEIEDWDVITLEEYKNGVLQKKVGSGENGSALEAGEVSRYSNSSFAVNSSGSASSSGRPLEEATRYDSGIEGILSRLAKERSINFGFDLSEKGNTALVQSEGGKDDWLGGMPKDMAVADLQRSNRSSSLNSGRGIINSQGKRTRITSFSNLNVSRNSLEAERAGFLNMEFKASEIVSNEEGAMSKNGIPGIREGSKGHLHRQEGSNASYEQISSNQIQSRLQDLKSELLSVLRSVKSNTDELVSQKGYERSSEELQKLSDAWEFQETEIMNAQDRLRSIRAKLAVLEGKMALAIIDAQKMVEEKQKRIDNARRDLRLIRTACIVWPNSAAEVLLAGSFDGWTSQRKMEKSSTGIFSLTLKLYPGKYEIKFIVDGEWKIDPLRPIVYSGGYENNLLMII